MTQVATITSKKQLTLPSLLFKKAGLAIGQKVIISEKSGSLVITSAEKLVEDLAGSLPVIPKWQDKNLEEIIATSQEEYFQKNRQ